MECFVCLQPGGERYCLCNSVAHHDCLMRVVETVRSHDYACPVCRYLYRMDVTVRRRVTHAFSVGATLAAVEVGIYVLMDLLFAPLHAMHVGMIALSVFVLVTIVVHKQAVDGSGVTEPVSTVRLSPVTAATA